MFGQTITGCPYLLTRTVSLILICREGYFTRGHYSTELAKCRECITAVSGAGSALAWTLLALILFLLSMRVLFVRTFGLLAWHEVCRRLRLTTGKLRILFMSIQTLTQTMDTSFVLMPPSFINFNVWLGAVGNFEALRIVPIECIGSGNLSPFFQRLLFYTITPLVLGLLAVLSFCIIYRSKMTHSEREGWFAGVAYLGLLFLYIIIVPTSAMVLKVFTCEEVDVDLYYLSYDLSVECYTTNHRAWMLYAAIMTLVYPIGVSSISCSHAHIMLIMA